MGIQKKSTRLHTDKGCVSTYHVGNRQQWPSLLMIAVPPETVRAQRRARTGKGRCYKINILFPF